MMMLWKYSSLKKKNRKVILPSCEWLNYVDENLMLMIQVFEFRSLSRGEWQEDPEDWRNLHKNKNLRLKKWFSGWFW